MKFDNYPELLSTAQLAEMLGIAKHTIEVLRCEGKFPIPHLNPFSNRTVRYAKSEVIAHLNGCVERADERSCA